MKWFTQWRLVRLKESEAELAAKVGFLEENVNRFRSSYYVDRYIIAATALARVRHKINRLEHGH